MNWITSDHHFGHKNIIAYEDRPFTSVQEMDAYMIKRWNETVSPDDTVYHVGDFALAPKWRIRELVELLHGRIVLILGNHDNNSLTFYNEVMDAVYKELVLYHDDAWSYGGNSSYLLLTHRPLNRYIHLQGETPLDQFRVPVMNQLNVAVECWDYRPIPLPRPNGWLNIHGHIHRSRVAIGLDMGKFRRIYNED